MYKRTLIFDDSIEGHHLEYIHHLYMGAVEKKEEEYVFILTPAFKQICEKLTWPKSSNIILDYISEEDLNMINKNKLRKAFYLSKIIQVKVKRYNVSNVFLITLMSAMPFLPFFINRKVKISGIIYLIYLYRWKFSPLPIRITDVIKNLILSKCKNFEYVYLLNDRGAPIYLNKKYRTSVYRYLPDPFVPLSFTKLKNLREELNIHPEKIICLHFGALTERKGTLEFLRAITFANKDILSKCCFIFAGKVYDDIKDSFYLLKNEVEKKTQIIIFDKFCNYDFIGSLCLSSNYIFIPYKNSEQSSGVLGYAAQFNIPVIGPRSGLLGKIIKKYNLGFLIKYPSVECLAKFINNIENLEFKGNTNYIRDNTVSNFINTILK